MLKEKKFVIKKEYYEILEISAHSTTIEIQRSFERLCDEYVNINSTEPETRKNSAEILFALTKAYEVLTDPFQRLAYDERMFPKKPPFNNEVETIFKEGTRAFRNNDPDGAIRFFKEAVYLFPHRTIYRVHLAIAYNEKGWKESAEKELRMALKLDPNNEFAKEVVASLLFKLSDKKNAGLFSNKVNRQLAAIAAVLILVCGALVLSVPKLVGSLTSNNGGDQLTLEAEAMKLINAQQPTASVSMTQPVNSKPQQNVAKASAITISKLDDNFVPQGSVSDYSEQKVTKKTYYEGQSMVVVELKSGAVLTYKTQDLVGWKHNPKTNEPVVITKSGEIIPAPTNLSITLSNGKTVSPNEAGFPASAFPEYGVSEKEVAKAVENTNVQATTNSAPIAAPEVSVAAPAVAPPAQNVKLAPPPSLPGGNK